MFNFDNITKENIKYHDLNWPEILDHQYCMLLEFLVLEKQICYLIS